MPNDNPQIERLWTFQDVAVYLHTTRQNIYKLIKEDKFPRIEMGGRIRFRKSDVDAWLEERKVIREDKDAD